MRTGAQMQIIISWPHIVYPFFFNTIQPLPLPLKNNLQNEPNFQAVAHIQKKPITSLATEMRKLASKPVTFSFPPTLPLPPWMYTC